MVKRLVVTLGFAAYGSMACADVELMSNTELDAVVLVTQPQQLQPVLPEYDSNGQIGVSRTLSTPSLSVSGPSAGGSIVTPSSSAGANGGIALKIPVPPLADLISNISRNLNIQQNLGR